MASTSHAPSPTIFQELEELFSWNPPRLMQNPDKRISGTASRRPTFFDKHFSDKAVLKRVVHIPSLSQILAETVDSALERAKAALPPSTKNFITAKQRHLAVLRQRTQVNSEKGVVEFFKATTGGFCPYVASTLLLHPDAVPEWQSFIFFTSDVSSDESSCYAILDAEHSFLKPGTIAGDERDLNTILGKMDSVTREFVKKMREDATVLTTFKLASLTAAPFRVFDDLIKTTEFSWERCESNPCTDPNHKTGRGPAAKIVVGRDAVHPPWNLLAPQSDHSKTTRSTTKAGGAPPLAMTLAMEQGEVSGHTGAGPSRMSPPATNPSEPARQSTAVTIMGPPMAPPRIVFSPHRGEKLERKRTKSKASQIYHSESSRTTRSATRAGHAPPLAEALAKEPRRMKPIHMKGEASVHAPLTMSPPVPNPSEPGASAAQQTTPVAMAGPSALAPSIDPSRGEKRKTPDSGVFSMEPTIARFSTKGLSPVKDKGKKRQKLDDVGHEDPSDATYEDPSGATYEDPSDVTYKDPRTMATTAHSFVQQAWAQATRANTSVVVLHSGNHEVIGIRHRSSQTLYVSDVIIPHECVDPGYGKIHVGIIIAAIQNAMDRMKRDDKRADDSQDGGGSGVGGPEAGSPSEGGNGAGGGPGAGGDPGGVEHSRDTAAQGGKAAERLDMEETVYVSSHCDLMHLYLQYGVYDSPTPASFIRSLPLNIPTNSPSFSPRHCVYGGQCMTIVITSEIGQGATGVALRGTLKPKNMEGAGSLDAVSKLAFDAEQRDSLRREYELYLLLKSKGVHRGITPTIGFFDDVEGSACALVMLYAGVPISTLDPGRMLSTSDYDSAMSTLESIHHAGIIHNDIRPENILISDSGVTIIDFGHAKLCNSEKAKDTEREIFRSILEGSAGEDQ